MEKRIPSTPLAKRVGALFNRRPGSMWNPKEIKSYKALVKSHAFDNLNDLALIERYYRSERMKGDKGIHRRDLATFLNNYHGELDRAKAWGNRGGGTKVGYSKPYHRPKPTMSDEEWKSVAEMGRQQLQEFRENFLKRGLDTSTSAELR